MIELVTVELKNFRSFADATFSPLGIGQGMTAINGANGMGKSSIVHAIVWALYGITPDGVRVGALRRQGSEGEGDVEAKVTLTFNGQTICVTRGLRGKNDTTIASIELDGVEQTNVSSRTASQWITNYIGLDAEAFLTAFVVRQKELDSLVRARPAERRKTIERLAGIERMSKALELARQESREAQRVVDALPAIADPEEIGKRLSEVREQLEIAEADQAAADSALELIQERKDRLSGEVAQARSAAEAKREIDQGVQLLDNRIEDLRNRIESLVAKAHDAEKLEAYSQEAKAADVAYQAVEEEWQLFQNTVQQLTIAQASLSSSEKAQEKAVGRHESATDALSQLQSAGSSLVLIDDSVLAEIRERIQNLNEEIGLTRGNHARMEKALAAISEHLHDNQQASCPTCEQTLADPDAIISALKEGIESARSAVPELQENLSAAQRELQEAEANNRAHTEHAQKISSAQQQVDESKATLDEAEEELRSARAAVDDIQAQLDLLGSSEAIEKQRLEARAIKESADANLRRAELAQEAAEEIENLQASLDKREEEKQEQASRLPELVKASENLEDLANELEEINSQLLPASAQAKEANFEVQRITQSVRDLEMEEETAKAHMETRKAALRDAEIAAATAQSLADFRTDRLARLTPELSEVATDFVSRMTDGKYTSVVLDDEFTPVLTDSNGQERPVAWLSGGEESAVALALRVAIGEVLAGQRGGLLVLDEVLTAQDASRRQATMSAIKNLPRQIITINHVSEATDMVDLVANIIDDGNGASTIEEWAPDVLGGNVSDAILDA